MASTDSGQFTSRHTNEILCSYSFGRKLWVYAFALSFASIGLLMTLAELVVVAQEVASGIPLDMQRIIGEILPLAGLIVFSLLFPLLFLSMYSDVHISEKGIRVQVISLWWIFVPWQDVLDSRPTIQASFWGHQRSQLVFVRKLTFLHWIIGWILGLRLKPAFNIKGTQEGYDDAVQMIKMKLGKA
jgi:hypothetical protein